MVAEMEGLKEKIKQNGHFKNLAGFSLTDELLYAAADVQHFKAGVCARLND
jgi:hypothetical protein